MDQPDRRRALSSVRGSGPPVQSSRRGDPEQSVGAHRVSDAYRSATADGAGAASICAIEINARSDPRIQAHVVGFGCPALLSQELAERVSDFVTTVVNDEDCVPRLSGIAVANKVRDILEFDWLPYAQRDIQSVLDELHSRQPLLFRDEVISQIRDTVVQPWLLEEQQRVLPPRTPSCLAVELFPPGKCIHFYRNGEDTGFSACCVPNTFFSEWNITRQMFHGE